MTVQRAKRLAAAIITLPLLAAALLNTATAGTRAAAQDPAAFDAAAAFKAKCAMCHGQKAEKNFDATKAEDVLVAAVKDGVKPKMPSYSKAFDDAQSKALVDLMKGLKQ